MNLQDRINSYHKVTGFPRSLFLGGDGRIVGTLIMGQNYTVKSSFYGGYPHGYLKRIAALFPDRRKVLHLFSGKVDIETMPGDTVDINPANNPTWLDDAQRLTNVPVEDYDLVLADPPYSVEDCDHYQCTMIKRNVVMAALGKRLKLGAFVVWLDQVLPMFRKDQFDMVGVIGMVKSTNHRFRVITIYQKNNLTDKQIPVYPSSPARDGHNNRNTDTTMTTKMLALIAGVLATAFSQIQNICLGGTEPDAPPADPAPKKGKPAKAKTAPEPEEEAEEETEEEETDVTVETEEEDDVDYDAMRESTKQNLVRLYTPKDQGGKGRVDLKPQVKALLTKAGVGSVTELPDDKVQPFIDAVLKLAKSK